MGKQCKPESGPGLTEILVEAESVVKKARRHNQPLGGNGFYARKFAALHADATLAFTAIAGKCSAMDGRLNKQVEEIRGCVETFFNPATEPADRNIRKQRCLFLLKTEIEPALANAVSHVPSDQFFPLEIVKNTGRNYILRVAEQACGSYDQGWYDSAAVMARRLLETLIIEVYEAKGIDSKLKKSDGTFHHLSGLIGVLLNETSFNISRNTKNSLPKLKDLGDQSAHNRRYIARQADLDAVKREFRIALEEFIHLAGFG